LFVVCLIVVDGFDDVELVGSVRIVVVGVVVLMVDDGLDAVVKIGFVLMYWIVGNGLSSSEGIALVDVVMLMVRCVNSIGLMFVQLKKNGHTCWCIT
jgi:hypothetical protein